MWTRFSHFMLVRRNYAMLAGQNRFLIYRPQTARQDNNRNEDDKAKRTLQKY